MAVQASPEARTTELFSQNFDVLARELHHRTVKIHGTNISIVLVKLNPYSLAQNQKHWLYSPMAQMEAGDFWARDHYLRKMFLSLIVAKDDGQVGACLQVEKANRVDPDSKKESPFPRQGDIATYLGLNKNEIGKLRFLDDSETLHLIPTGRIVDKISGTQINPHDADHELGRLVNE